MEPRIEFLSAKKLVGLHQAMSLAEDRTPLLWRSFMPRRKEIRNTTGTDLYSLQVYPPGYFENFNPQTVFEKWAAVEAADADEVPAGMEVLTLPGGLYAVFQHKGGPRTGPETFRYIFGTWLPQSEYVVDERPHFELLGEKYKHDEPDSEEEIWVPVRQHGQGVR